MWGRKIEREWVIFRIESFKNDEENPEDEQKVFKSRRRKASREMKILQSLLLACARWKQREELH